MYTMHTLLKLYHLYMMQKGGNYHHGDLASAFAERGFALARSEGPSGISVRRIAKELGVTPMAAYRHYPSVDSLMAAVSQLARQEFTRMLATRPNVAEGAPLDRLRALGASYVLTALDEPALFATAFMSVSVAPSRPDSQSGWELYRAVLSGTDPEHLPAIFTFAWSAVHGLAVLLGSGRYSESERDTRIESTLDLIESAIIHGPTR